IALPTMTGGSDSDKGNGASMQRESQAALSAIEKLQRLDPARDREARGQQPTPLRPASRLRSRALLLDDRDIADNRFRILRGFPGRQDRHRVIGLQESSGVEVGRDVRDIETDWLRGVGRMIVTMRDGVEE